MASTAWLVVALPEGWDPEKDGLPDDVASALVGTAAESSGGGYDQDNAGQWQLRKQVTGSDRLHVAEALARTMTDLGYRARVHMRK